MDIAFVDPAVTETLTYPRDPWNFGNVPCSTPQTVLSSTREMEINATERESISMASGDKVRLARSHQTSLLVEMVIWLDLPPDLPWADAFKIRSRQYRE